MYHELDECFVFPNGIRQGNAQIMGFQEYQNDYFIVLHERNRLLAVVADGITQKLTGRASAELCCSVLKRNFQVGLDEASGVETFYKESINIIRRQMRDCIMANTIGAYLSSVLITERQLHFVSMGSCRFVLCREGTLRNVSRITEETELMVNQIKLLPNDVIMLCSKGAFDSLTEIEMLQVLDSPANPQEKVQRLCNIILTKQYKEQDNATILIFDEFYWSAA